MEWAVGIWVVLATILCLNGLAAGAAAILHAWRSPLKRGGRTFWASAVAGFLPTSAFVALAFLGSTQSPTEDPGMLLGVFGMFFTVATIVSIPGAIIVANKLEQPGEEFRAFE